jgi:hypothetical protein
VDVDDPSLPPAGKAVRQNPHKPRQADEFDVRLREFVVQFRIVSLAIAVLTPKAHLIDDDGRHAGVACNAQAGRIAPARDDKRNLTWIIRCPRSLDQRAHIAAAPGNQDSDARARRHVQRLARPR